MTLTQFCSVITLINEATTASYFDSWLGKLRSDNMYIFKAAAEASKAAGYLLSRAGIAGIGSETDESDEVNAAQAEAENQTSDQ